MAPRRPDVPVNYIPERGPWGPKGALTRYECNLHQLCWFCADPDHERDECYLYLEFTESGGITVPGPKETVTRPPIYIRGRRVTQAPTKVRSYAYFRPPTNKWRKAVGEHSGAIV
jgi:hypothetical protein